MLERCQCKLGKASPPERGKRTGGRGAGGSHQLVHMRAGRAFPVGPPLPRAACGGDRFAWCHYVGQPGEKCEYDAPPIQAGKAPKSTGAYVELKIERNGRRTAVERPTNGRCSGEGVTK
jgi:hypothetical protein